MQKQDNAKLPRLVPQTLVLLLLAVQWGKADTLRFTGDSGFNFYGRDPAAFMSCVSVGDLCIDLWGPGDVNQDGTPSDTPATYLVSFNVGFFVTDAGDGTVGNILNPWGPFNSQMVQIEYISAGNGSDPGSPCGYYFSCNIKATGGPQLAGTVTWSDGTVDRIEFVGVHAADVPEPATLTLLLGALCVCAWKRKVISRSS